MCCKLWEEITFPRFASHVRYGVKAGQLNPRFLDATLFNEMVLTSYREAKFQPHAGPFLFEFQRHDLPTEEFCSRLAGFFDQPPREFRYGVEIRNPALLGPQYHRCWNVMAWLMSTTIGRTCRRRSLNNMRAWMALPHRLRC